MVYFVNSGSEANDLAILLARAYTENHDIISLQNCYHGASGQTVSLTSTSKYKYPIPQLPGFHHVSIILCLIYTWPNIVRPT